jgi:hypothetical protein
MSNLLRTESGPVWIELAAKPCRLSRPSRAIWLGIVRRDNSRDNSSLGAERSLVQIQSRLVQVSHEGRPRFGAKLSVAASVAGALSLPPPSARLDSEGDGQGAC